MKSKRAAAAASEGDKHIADPIVDEQSVKKRKRSDDDGETNGAVKKSKKDKKDKEKSKDKKDKKKKKKDHKGETRKEKKDKRKDLQNLPEGMEGGDEKADEPEVEVEAESKKEKKEKKTKSKEDKVNGAEDKDSKKKKEKKEKKQDSKLQEPPAAAAPTDEKPTTNGTDDAIDLDASSARKPGRNIVFVGNLPFTATAATITAHFASLKPIAVRCLTNKGDTKATCKGIAFVEFGTPQQQRTCLDKFHHSTFEDGISPARKINVELTAGGGGKNQNRQDKIREKNKKLDENRQKRIDTEKQEKLENNGASKQQQQARTEDYIHPSRLARLPNLGK